MSLKDLVNETVEEFDKLQAELDAMKADYEQLKKKNRRLEKQRDGIRAMLDEIRNLDVDKLLADAEEEEGQNDDD